MKLKSAVTGKYTKAKGADPAKTYKSDDYPARMLRKLVRKLDVDHRACYDEELEKLIANIKRKMKWDQPKPRKVK